MPQPDVGGEPDVDGEPDGDTEPRSGVAGVGEVEGKPDVPGLDAGALAEPAGGAGDAGEPHAVTSARRII